LRKRLAIASAVIAIPSFVVKEMVKDKLNEMDDSLGAAQSKYESEADHSGLSVQVATTQQQVELMRIEAVRNDPNKNYSSLTVQNKAETRLARANLNSDFDDVSRLIDSLPIPSSQLQQMRDQLRDGIQKTNSQIDETLKAQQKSVSDYVPLLQAKTGQLMAQVQQIVLVLLADSVLKVAQHEKDLVEKAMRVCDWAFCILGLSALVLALSAALAGAGTSD
jgi:uncharacterized phage infection (PIP) family protein YhgE